MEVFGLKKSLFIGGIIIIFILSFIIPNNPYMIVPSMSLIGFDKPLWLVIFVFFSFLFSLILNCVYSKLDIK